MSIACCHTQPSARGEAALVVYHMSAHGLNTCAVETYILLLLARVEIVRTNCMRMRGACADTRAGVKYTTCLLVGPRTGQIHARRTPA